MFNKIVKTILSTDRPKSSSKTKETQPETALQVTEAVRDVAVPTHNVKQAPSSPPKSKLQSPQAARRMGAWYGLIVGDALGAPYEFMDAQQIKNTAPPKLAMSGGGIWDPGEWTDDTALTLTSAAAYQGAAFKPNVAADAMVKWLATDPKDIGNLTREALILLRDGKATPASAGDLVLVSLPGSAGNGSLMRALPTALVRSPEDARLKTETETLSRITHAEPRCVAACIAFNSIVATLIATGGNVAKSLAAGVASAEHPDVRAVVQNVANGGSAHYVNDHGIGFVLLALERGLLALRDSKSFDEGVSEVIRMGGDADTNAAIAGALLGARDGFESIPGDWVNGLDGRDTLDYEFQRLLNSSSVVKVKKMEEFMPDVQNLKVMASFLTVLNAPGFAIYDVDEKNHRQYSSTVQAFMVAAEHWIEPGFAWNEWSRSEEGRRLLSTPAAIDQATPKQLSHMLTALLRGERFSDGNIGRAIQAGIVSAILRRIETLSKDP